MAESSGSLVTTNNTNIQKHCSAVQGEERTEEKKTEKVMEPMFLEDYKINEDPKPLICLLEWFKSENIPPTINEVMSGLIYILMMESGFIPTGGISQDESGSFCYKRLLRHSLHLPKNWRKEHFCSFSFVLLPFHVHVCQVSCVPAADDLVINCVIRSIENASFNTILDPLAYIVNFNISNLDKMSFQNFKGLSQKFKNEICFPAKCAIFNYTNERFCCLEHLPEEVIICILEKLKVKDLLNVRLCNKYFKRLTEEPSLWRALLYKDFKFKSDQMASLSLRVAYRELHLLPRHRPGRWNSQLVVTI